MQVGLRGIIANLFKNKKNKFQNSKNFIEKVISPPKLKRYTS